MSTGPTMAASTHLVATLSNALRVDVLSSSRSVTGEGKQSGIPFGEYRLIRRLGSGGMAEVFLAKREGPGGFEKNLVIKRILPHLSVSKRFTELFLKEARLAALVDHPNLVHVSSFGQIDGQYYLAMEWVDGSTVADFLSRVGATTPGVACRIAVDLLGALQAIHGAKNAEGQPLELVHRDVGARNVMLTRDGNVKLLDFGIAVTNEDEGLESVGTKKYMAPEQKAAASVDHRADLFGVGVLLLEMMTSEAEVPSDRPEEVPEPLWKVVQSLVHPEVAQRPASAREVQASLEMFLATRGLEGTRSHLADLMDQVLPKRSKPRRVLSRITQMTNLTNLTRLTGADESMAPSARRRWLLPLLGLTVIGLVWVAWPSSEPPPTEAEAVLPPPAPPPIARPQVPTATAAPVPPVPPVARKAPPPPAKRRVRKKQKRKARPGRLTLDTRPWTRVYLGGRLLGMTPVVNKRLPSGKHQLRLENPDLGLKKTITVTIKPGRTTRIQKTL